MALENSLNLLSGLSIKQLFTFQNLYFLTILINNVIKSIYLAYYKRRYKIMYILIRISPLGYFLTFCDEIEDVFGLYKFTRASGVIWQKVTKLITNNKLLLVNV